MKELIQEVKKIPIRDIIESRIEVIGNDAICPFHNDSSIGSFKISNDKGIFKCFSCGESGDGIKFISKFDGISYKDAVYRIAYEFELITKNELENRKVIKINEDKKFVEKKSQLAELASEEILNLVYKAFMKKGLNERDKKYLLSERHLTEKDLEIGEYFSMPTEREALILAKRVLKQNGLIQKDLIGIPGFYMEGKKIRFSSFSGIGIPIKDLDENVISIQVRVQKGNTRYKWISSSFANGKDGKTDGVSCGSAIACIKPKSPTFPGILITEGHFKAVVFAREFNAPTLAVQGVNSIDGIEWSLSAYQREYKNEYIFIGFDADMMHNIDVFNAACKLSEKAKTIKKCKTCFLIWDERLGKGLDDLIINGNKKAIKVIDCDKYIKIYNDVLKKLGDKTENKELLKEELLKTFKLKKDDC